MQNRKRLSDILNGGGGWIESNWGDIPAAPEFGPIPPGKYVAHLKDAQPHQAKKGTAGVKLAFEIIEGEHKGKKCWYDIWLTEAAKSLAVRDLGKLGIHSREQLEGPIPRWIRCLIVVKLNKNDQGEEFNRVRSFEVLGIDKPERDPFAPLAEPEGGPTQ